MKKILSILTLLLMSYFMVGCKNTKTLLEDFVNKLPGEIDTDMTLPETLNKQEVTYTYKGTSLTSILPYPYFNKDTIIAIEVGYKDLVVEKKILVKKSPIIHDLYINTVNQTEITSKDDYILGSVSIKGSESFEMDPAAMSVRGRGNSTWEFPKKAYKIKFDERQSLLGMTSAKEYVLLAEYVDKSLIRNYMAHFFSSFLNIEHSLETRFVSVFVNNSYRGVYLLTEQVGIDQNRLSIDKSDAAAGGFLIELETEDRIDREGIKDINWVSVDNSYFVIKSPKMEKLIPEVISGKVTYIKDYLNAFLYSIESNTYDEFIDVDSFIDFFIISEFFKQVDVGYSSVYAYKDMDEKLFMGPIWDFDISSGNGDYYDYKYYGYWVDYNPWFKKLIQNQSFEDAYIKRFNEVMTAYFDIFIAELDYVSSALFPHAERNFKKWGILDKYVWPNPPEMVEANTYSKQITYLKTYMINRKNWLLKELNTKGYYL